MHFRVSRWQHQTMVPWDPSLRRTWLIFLFFPPPLTHHTQENLHTQTHTPGAKTHPSCYISFLLKIRLAPNYNLNHLSAFRSVIVTTCHTVILQVPVVNFGIATTTTTTTKSPAALTVDRKSSNVTNPNDLCVLRFYKVLYLKNFLIAK